MDTEEGSGDDSEDLTLNVTTEPAVDIDDDKDDEESLFLEPQSGPSSVPLMSSGYYSPVSSPYGGYGVPPPPPSNMRPGPVLPSVFYPARPAVYYPSPPHYSMYLYGRK